MISKVFRQILIPAAAVVAEQTKSTANECCCRPSDLPIYSFEPPPPARVSDLCKEPNAVEQTFQDAIGAVRRTIGQVMGGIKEIEALGEDYISEGVQTVMCYVEFLQQEDNTTPKYGAIAIGGLTGFILGLRGRIIKKTIYTSVGALSMAAVCYPKEANEYSQIFIEEAKHYFTIGYNFMYGVKKGDPPLELPSLPTFPHSLSDAWKSAKNLASPISSSVNVADKETEDEKKS